MLGTAQILKPYNQIGYYHLYFLIYFDFHIVLLFFFTVAENLASERYVIERNAVV